MSAISDISLSHALPKVFADDAADPESGSAIWRTDATLARGNAYCIHAASGTGKTSLCSFLMGVRHDYLGTISFDGVDIRSYGPSQWSRIRRENLAYLPQELELFEELTAFDNVMLKNRLTDACSEAEIRTMFEQLEIDNRISSPVGRMSVGQRQRVALIRAVCQPFDFILLDEPVSHLDSRNNRLCGELVARRAAATGGAIVSTSVGNPLVLPFPATDLKL